MSSGHIQAIYTDGACSGNPGSGGWGTVVYFNDGSIHEMGGADPQTTNNRMEMQAAIAALEFLKTQAPGAPIVLHTDSEYVKNGITKWIAGWKSKGWKTAAGKPVLNQDLWQQLDQLNSRHIEWRYVRGHAGIEGNERCDTIARAFSVGKMPALKTLQSSKPSSTATTMPEAPAPNLSPIAADLPDAPTSERRVTNLRNLMDVLHIADEIARQGYLITSSELADLMDVHASAVTSRGEHWGWRNWVISRVRREGNQILWQLERLEGQPSEGEQS